MIEITIRGGEDNARASVAALMRSTLSDARCKTESDIRFMFIRDAIKRLAADEPVVLIREVNA